MAHYVLKSGTIAHAIKHAEVCSDRLVTIAHDRAADNYWSVYDRPSVARAIPYDVEVRDMPHDQRLIVSKDYILDLLLYVDQRGCTLVTMFKDHNGHWCAIVRGDLPVPS